VTRIPRGVQRRLPAADTPPMQISAPGTTDALGQAQLMMLRKSMDMAVQNNAQLLASMPAAPAAGRGGSVDVYA